VNRSNLLTEIETLDPETDHCRIVYLTLCDGFLWDVTRALELALFRTFAAPSIGRLLHRTGEFETSGQKRYDDTTLLLLTILRSGYDSELGLQAIARMNKTHSHFPISNEDYLFVLSTFVIDPIDWMDRFGWRSLSNNEKQSLFLFWRNVGQRMQLESIPESLEQMESESWQYVEEHFTFDEANQHVADGTIEIVKGWLPAMFRPLVRPVASTLLDDRTRAAVGMQQPSLATQQAVHWALRTRAVMKRLTHLRHQPDWPSGHRTYPDGYQVDQLAPRRLLEIEQSEPLRQRH
jgi:hypothetical protein